LPAIERKSLNRIPLGELSGVNIYDNELCDIFLFKMVNADTCLKYLKNKAHFE